MVRPDLGRNRENAQGQGTRKNCFFHVIILFYIYQN